jgi:hypothetical protein
MKGNLVKMSNVNRKETRWLKNSQRKRQSSPRAKPNLVETFARMWIECDPNRGGPGLGPDDLQIMTINGKAEMRPRWEWFIPRAKASIKYLKEREVL